MPFVGLAAPSAGVPDIPLITGGSRISNLLPLAVSQPKARISVPRRVSPSPCPSPAPAPSPVSARLVSPPSLRLAAAAAHASDSSARTAIPSPPAGPLRPRPQVLPSSRLPVPCKRRAQDLSASPAPVESFASWRKTARENRPRPWLQGSALAAQAAPSLARAQSPVAVAPVTDNSLVERRRARQERDRPWSASRHSSSPRVPVPPVSPPPPAPSHRARHVLRSALKTSGSNTAQVQKNVAFAEEMLVRDHPRWIVTNRHVYDHIRRR